jgi:GTP-binding protein EngB required for normal cell division
MEIELKEKYDVLLKLIIIGDSSVGKSCILNNYLRNSCKFNRLNLFDTVFHISYNI